ncbi:MAG: hypothetical protein KIT15_16680 [Xanthobacteraceae bacterium]|nr:hypothetical protein [Xanthobacteraceae bacterium]
MPRIIALAVCLLAISTSNALAQRGGEVTVTISPPPEMKAALPNVSVAGEHRLHFNNTTSRDAKILSMEILFIEQSETSKSCDLFFGNVIGATVRRYDLKDIEVPSAKAATAKTKLLPAEDNEGVYKVAPLADEKRNPRVTIIACYKFVFLLDDSELEVTPLAGRWLFDRKTGKLISKNVAGKAELLPR